MLLDPDEALALAVPGHVPAAVLVPLYLPAAPAPHAAESDATQLHAVLTRRHDDLRRHAGEISFPGGRQDPDDADLRATALREAEEEIGLAREAVTVVGALQPTSTIATNYAIYPFVGLLAPGQRWRISPREVDEVLELPLRELRDGFHRAHMHRRGLSFWTDAYAVADNFIWGATARILRDLLERLGPAVAAAPGSGAAGQSAARRPLPPAR